MILAFVYFLIALILICGAAWLVVYVTRVAGMPDPPRGAIVFVAWIVAGVGILLAFVYMVVPRLPALP